MEDYAKQLLRGLPRRDDVNHCVPKALEWEDDSDGVGYAKVGLLSVR